jgi:hypothetical protein
MNKSQCIKKKIEKSCEVVEPFSKAHSTQWEHIILTYKLHISLGEQRKLNGTQRGRNLPKAQIDRLHGN